MNILSPRIGNYIVWNVKNEIVDGRECPVAEVQFKEHHWKNFGDNLYHIKLRGLYFIQSDGPKEIKPDDLRFMIINLLKIEEVPHPNCSAKTQFKLTWNVNKPFNYEELKRQQEEIESDFLIEQEDPELLDIEGDFLLGETFDFEIAKSILGDTIIAEENGLPNDEDEDGDIPF